MNFTYPYEGTVLKLETQVRKYVDTDALFIRIVDSEDGSPFATLTVNIPPYVPDEGYIIVKTWGENEPITKYLLKQGFFIDTRKRIKTGYVEASIWKVNCNLES